MCNLNVVFQKANTPKQVREAIPGFVMAVTTLSYVNNSDGDGVYANGYLWKGQGKVDVVRIADRIKDAPVILSHQRIATSGFNGKFTQPFASKEFVLIHNGIINDFVEQGKSDTWGFFHQFCSEFEKAKGKRDCRVVATIKKLLDGNRGFYSIALLDRVTGTVFYFRNSWAQISLWKSKHVLYLATDKGNKRMLPMLGEKFKEVTVGTYVINRIDPSTLEVTEVGCIDEPKAEQPKTVASALSWSDGWATDPDEPVFRAPEYGSSSDVELVEFFGRKEKPKDVIRWTREEVE